MGFQVIKQDKKGNIEKAAITDAVAFYTKFQEPSVIFDQKDLPKNQQTHFEWTVELVVDENTADAYDETSPKQTAKKLSKTQVAKKFKLEDENGQPDDEAFKNANLDPSLKKFYIIKKSQQCQTKEGKSLKSLQPRAVQVIDGKPVDITFDKLVGNGSKVSLLLRYATNPTYGTFSYPAILKVEELIEYEGSGGKGVDAETSDFLGGVVEFAEAPEEAGSEAANEEQPPFNMGEETPDFGDSDDDLY